MSTRRASRSRPTSALRPRGFTLPELLLVASILVVLGSAMAPQLRAPELSRLELAAASVAAALRFARDESLRTGSSHSVFIDPATNQVQVALLPDFSALPIDLPLVRHPLSRAPYAIDLDDDPTLTPVAISMRVLDYDGMSNRERVDFSARGLPLYHGVGGQRFRLLDGQVTLTLGGAMRSVAIAPQTGAIAIGAGP